MYRAHRTPVAAATALILVAWRVWPAAPAAQSSYKTGIDVVGFTVTAVDRSGKPVAIDLKAEDFDIREDGVPARRCRASAR